MKDTIKIACVEYIINFYKFSNTKQSFFINNSSKKPIILNHLHIFYIYKDHDSNELKENIIKKIKAMKKIE